MNCLPQIEIGETLAKAEHVTGYVSHRGERQNAGEEKTGMEWRIESQDELPKNAGYMITIAEYTDSGHLTGTAVTLACRSRLDEGPLSTEGAVRNILRQVRIRIGEYLGYESVSLSEN